MKSAAKQRCKTNKKKKIKYWEIQVNNMANTRGRGRGQQAQRNVNNSLNLQLHAHLAHTHTQRDACNVCWMCLGQHSPRIVCIYIGMYLADTRHTYPCAYGSHSPFATDPPPLFGESKEREWRHLMFAHIMTRPIRFCNHKPIGNTFGIRTKNTVKKKEHKHTQFTRRCK